MRIRVIRGQVIIELYMEPLIINNEIVLEPLDLKHAGDVFYTINTYRDQLREWLPFVDKTEKVEDTVTFIEYGKTTDDLTFAIIYNGRFAGLVGLKDLNYPNRRGEIGYWISPEFQNRGLATTCSRFLIDYGFYEMNLNRIQIRIGVGNVKSNRVAEKLNFRFEGIERDGELLISGFHNINVYSLLKSEWEANK